MNLPIASAIDNKEYSLEDLKLHLARNGVMQKHYCLNILKKTCLATNQPLLYKSLEHYLLHDFNDESHVTNWAVKYPSLAKEYSLFLIKRRKILKPFEWALSQTELKSLGFPSIKYYTFKFGDYNNICINFNLKTKYNYTNPKLTYSREYFDIYIDTREKQPFDFGRQKIEKLEYGDYKCSSKPNLAIERKSLPDLVSTFVGDFERVEREIQRAYAYHGSLIILCEESLDKALNFHKNSYIKQFTKINSSVLFHNIRLLIQKYPNIQFGFCSSREHMEKVILKIFACEQDILQFDIQYLIEENIL